MEVIVVRYLEASTRSQQALRLHELAVVGAKYDRDIPYRSLQRVMDTHAKATTHIGHVAIMIDRGKQAKAVDDETIRLGRRLWRGLRIAHCLAIELGKYLAQMLLGDNMGSDDKFPFRMGIEEADEDVLVGRPTAAGHEHLRGIAHEGLYQRQPLGGLLDGEHTVETGIAHYVHRVDMDGTEQLAALLVLHEETGDAAQDIAIAHAIPLEKHLARAENAAHAISGHTLLAQEVEVIIPKLVLNEERHDGTSQPQEANGIERRV